MFGTPRGARPPARPMRLALRSGEAGSGARPGLGADPRCVAPRLGTAVAVRVDAAPVSPLTSPRLIGRPSRGCSAGRSLGDFRARCGRRERPDGWGRRRWRVRRRSGSSGRRGQAPLVGALSTLAGSCCAGRVWGCRGGSCRSPCGSRDASSAVGAARIAVAMWVPEVDDRSTAMARGGRAARGPLGPAWAGGAGAFVGAGGEFFVGAFGVGRDVHALRSWGCGDGWHVPYFRRGQVEGRPVP